MIFPGNDAPKRTLDVDGPEEEAHPEQPNDLHSRGGAPSTSPVAVVIAGDERVRWGCAVAGRSLVEHAPAGTSIDFYLIHPGMAREEVDRFRRSWQAPERSVTVTDIPFELAHVKDLVRSKNLTHMAYARLFIGDLLPESVKRCVYIDTDVVFALSIVDLIQHPSDGSVVGAVPNGDGSDDTRHFERLGVAAGRYFNSGVMAIDLEQWRSRDIGRAAIRFLRGFQGRLALLDQDALNVVLADSWQPLESHWNSWASRSDRFQDQVTHFTMVPKPWHVDFKGPGKVEFFSYLDRTEFEGQRPSNWLGLGASFMKLKRLVPYWPSVPRILAQELRRLIRR